MDINEIRIKKSIIHILDKNISMPVLSDSELELDEEINEFIKGHLFKILSGDDYKECEFISENSYVYNHIINIDEQNFLDTSKLLTKYLFDFILKHIDIPSSDLLICIFEIKNIEYLSLLKMNYKTSYIHSVQSEDKLNNNSIIKYKTILPSEKQKLSEAIIINLDDYSIKLVEKKYEIDGQKENYLSKYYLESVWELSSSTKLNIINKTVDSINKKYFDDDIEKKMEFKNVINKEYKENGEISIDNVVEKVFKNNIEIKQEIKEKLDKYGMKDEKISFQSKSNEKKYEKQHIKTDTGIELNIPIEQYNNKENLEFIVNQDGTMSILIKNINKITGN